MDQIVKQDDSAGIAEEREILRRENEDLARQIRRLIKAESRLYAFQELLDSQLREYKGLHELNGKLIRTFDLGTMFAYTCEYVINRLEYERVLILLGNRDTCGYVVSAIDGYYDPAERDRVAGLVIEHDDPLLSPLLEGSAYLLCSADAESRELVEYRQRLSMHEYLVYPLCAHELPLAFLVVGNSAENFGFYHRVKDDEGSLLGIGNLVGLLSPSLENRILYENMNRALELVRSAEAKYRNIFENAAEGIFQASAEGRIISCNSATASILGYASPDDLIASVIDIESQLYVNPLRRRELLEMLQHREDVKNFEVEFYRKDGCRQWTQLSLHPTFNEKGAITRIDGIMLDIAERKRTEELIRKSLHEKETLLREIHHRVKNNLQIISTLFDLQSGSITDVESTRLFMECQDRIRTIALIHEKLYETVDFASIDFAEYLESLVRYLFGMYLTDDRISLTFSATATTVGIDEAIPCGLIVNELVTNSLKYAFPDGRHGELVLLLDLEGDGMISLTVGDDGVGLPPGLNYRDTETLGLQLVTLLVKQLRGSVELKVCPGTVFTIKFPFYPPVGRM